MTWLQYLLHARGKNRSDQLVVVMWFCFGPRTLRSGRLGDCIQCVGIKMFAHMLTGNIPNGKKDALAFVVT